MGCKYCLDEPYKDKLCTGCYARRVHKRITKALRGTLEDSDSNVFILHDDTAPAVVLEKVVRTVLENSSRVIIVGQVVPEDVDRVLVPDTVDIVLARALESIAKTGANVSYPKVERRPLARLTVEDCELLATRLGLTFTRRDSLNFPGLDVIEKSNPGIRATLAKALDLF